MNKVFSYLRRSIVPVLAVTIAGMLFSACLKDKDNNNANVPAAGLMSFNLAPDQQSVTITLSNNTLTRSPLAYTNFSGVYQPIYVGNRQIAAFDYPETTPLASTSFNFEQDKYYSLFVVGINNNYRTIVAHDNIDSLSATNGKAYIRYINAITDSVNTSNVTIAAGGANVVNDNAAYASISQFTPVNPGDVNIAVKNSNGVDANRTITVEQSKVYTILLAGVPGATDDSKKVQIKFILNGALTDDQNK